MATVTRGWTDGRVDGWTTGREDGWHLCKEGHVKLASDLCAPCLAFEAQMPLESSKLQCLGQFVQIESLKAGRTGKGA